MKLNKALIACNIALIAASFPSFADTNIKVNITDADIFLSDQYLECPVNSQVLPQKMANTFLLDLPAYIGLNTSAYIDSGKMVQVTDNKSSPRIITANPNGRFKTLCISTYSVDEQQRKIFTHNRNSDGVVCPTGSRLIGMEMAKANRHHISNNLLGKWGFGKIDPHNIIAGWGYNGDIKGGDNHISICTSGIDGTQSRSLNMDNVFVDDVQLYPDTDANSKVVISANGKVQFPVMVKVRLIDQDYNPVTTPFDEHMSAEDINGKLINFVRLYEGVLYNPNAGSEIAIDGASHTTANPQWFATRVKNNFQKRNTHYSVNNAQRSGLSYDEIHDGYHLFQFYVSTTDLMQPGETAKICARIGNEKVVNGYNQTWDTCQEGRNEHVLVNTVAPYTYDISDFTVKDEWVYRSSHERVWVQKTTIEPRGFDIAEFEIKALPNGRNFRVELDSRIPGLTTVGRFFDDHHTGNIGTDQTIGVTLLAGTKFDKDQIFYSWPLKGFKFWSEDVEVLDDLDYNPSMNGISFFNVVFNKYKISHFTDKGWKFAPALQLNHKNSTSKDYDVAPIAGKIKGYDVYGDSFDIIFDYNKNAELFELRNIN